MEELQEKEKTIKKLKRIITRLVNKIEKLKEKRGIIK